MHQALGEAAPAPPPARPGPGVWPWLVALIPWAVLLNYLRLEWSANAQYGYGFVVPLLSLYLVLQLWPTRPEPRPLHRPRWLLGPAAFLSFIALPLLLFVEASPEWRLIGWLLAAVTTGLSVCLLLQRGGWPWLRHFAFPLFFIFAAVPWPTSMEYKVMLPLMQADAATAVEILNWCGVPAIQHQNVIQLPNGFVGVDEACSGIRSLQTTLMIALFIGEWLQFRAGRRFLLLAAALILTYAFNLFRTLLLVSLSAGGGAATLHRWHDTVGMGVLLLSLGGLWLLAVLLRGKTIAASSPPLRILSPAPWPKGVMAGLAIWWLAAIVGTQIWFDAHETGAKPAPLWTVVWPKNLPTYQPVEIPVEARTSFMYSTEESSAAQWQAIDTSSLWLGYFLRWQPGRETSILASTHRPDVCLPATGKPLVDDDGVTNFQVAGFDLPVHIYQFDDGGQPLFVFYCVSVGGRDVTADSGRHTAVPGWLTLLCRVALPFTPASELNYRLDAIAHGRRNQGQQVLELGLWGHATLAEARQAFSTELNRVIARAP